MGSIMGPRSRKFISWTATMLSITVLRISLTDAYALSAPGIAPQMPPPIMPAIMTIGSSKARGVSGIARATAVESNAPAMICPSPPMLITLARKAMVMPMPTRSSGVARTAVTATRSPEPNAPSIIALAPLIGFSPRARIMSEPSTNATNAAPSGTLAPSSRFIRR